MFRTLVYIAILSLVTACDQSETLVKFKSNWPSVERVWIGPEYWTNPMQDWQLSSGRVECITSGGDRNMYLLTYELDSIEENFTSSITFGSLEDSLSEGWVGFKIGVRGEFKDFKDNAVRGEGMPIGLTHEGKLFIGYLDQDAPSMDIYLPEITLKLTATRSGNRLYQLLLEAFDQNQKLVASYERAQIANHLITGGLALACSANPPLEVKDQRQYVEYPDWGTEANTERKGNFRFWFNDWQLRGNKLKNYPERSFGPILFTQFTVSENTLNLTAQLPPLGQQDTKEVSLEIQESPGAWTSVSTSPIDPMSRTAKFTYDLSSNYEDTPYRVVYASTAISGDTDEYYFEGLVPHEPIEKPSLVVAAFTGNNDLGFPNNDLVRSVTLQEPDFLFFSGDQIYEGVGGYGAQRHPVEKASIDYLRKWYMFGWTYRDLLRRVPSVSIPDDHDVYHGNIWGASGKAANTDLETHHEQQDSGGYKMPPDWVNMVQRTQTGHLPEPYNDTPVKQGIGVYYTNIEYGGISFAVIEDRKFKSAPKALLPEGQIHNGWYQNPEFDPVTQADHPQAVLLGQRQLDFLEWWSTSWNQQTWMKVLLSQTIFANVATLPRAEVLHDNVVPTLRILNEGEYAPDDIPAADMDSNGWPQSGRNQALKLIRRAFALHIAGDQHLGSTIQYGVDDHGDSGFAICVPSVSNVFPRRWYPPRNPETNSNTGDFKDGFGNLITVMAVSNPTFTGREPAKLYDRATGYGIVRFNQELQQISLENWPRDADPKVDTPYKGWPVVIDAADNYRPRKGAFLPLINNSSKNKPLIQLVTAEGELLWTMRVTTDSVDLKVPTAGNYTLRASTETVSEEYQVIATSDPNRRGMLKITL